MRKYSEKMFRNMMNGVKDVRLVITQCQNLAILGI